MKSRVVILSMILCGCGNMTMNSLVKTAYGLPTKLIKLEDGGVEFKIPVGKIDGYQTDLQVRILLTNTDIVPIPVIPHGGGGGLRVSW